MTVIEPNKTHLARALVIILLATLFFIFEFVLQTSPAVMTDDLMRTFNLDALGVSTLAAFFFYGYAPMQLPGGLLYDRFGPRVVITFAAIICTLGALLFSQAHSYAMAAVGRLMMGIGGACSFVGVLVVASRWFPSRYFALIAGLLQLLGCAAAIVGQVPLAAIVADLGWQHTIFSVFLAGVVLSVLIPIFVRDYPPGVEIPVKKKLGHGEIHNLATIFRNPQTTLVAIYSFFSWMPMIVFAGLWGIDFLSEKFHVPTTLAAELMAAVWIGNALGSPFVGWWSEKLGRRHLPLYLSALIGCVAALILVYSSLPMWLAIVCLFFFGVGASGQALSFAVVKDNNGPATVGTAMGFNNFAVVVGGAICQPFVGWLLRLVGNGTMLNGVHHYTAGNFQQAFFILPLGFLLCAVVGRFFVKETFCRPQ